MAVWDTEGGGRESVGLGPPELLPAGFKKLGRECRCDIDPPVLGDGLQLDTQRRT